MRSWPRLGFIIAMCASVISCAGTPQLSMNMSPNASIARKSSIAVVPAKIGGRNDLVLPDAIATELLGLGVNVVERTSLSQMANEKGLDFTEILNGEEYFKIGTLGKIDIVVIVNSTIEGSAVANASVRVVELASGRILLSASYSQPAPDDPAYVYYDSLIKTARKLTSAIGRVIH